MSFNAGRKRLRLLSQSADHESFKKFSPQLLGSDLPFSLLAPASHHPRLSVPFKKRYSLRHRISDLNDPIQFYIKYYNLQKNDCQAKSGFFPFHSFYRLFPVFS